MNPTPDPIGPEPAYFRRKRLRRRALLIALAVIVLGTPIGLVLWRLPMLLETHPEQDQCEFGTGSTALYDRLRAEADAYLDEHGRARLGWFTSKSAQKFGREIVTQLEEFAMSRPTATERWAAIHAMLRSYGMEFDVNGPKDEEKLSLGKVKLSSIYFFVAPTYNLLCLRCYIFPEATISIYIEPGTFGTYDQVRSVVNLDSFSIKGAPLYYRRFHQTCPQVLR